MLKCGERRRFMAQVVNTLGYGGQRFAETVLGWNRVTIRKGQHEVKNGVPIVDQYDQCGRKSTEEHLPNLLTSIQSIVEPSGQTDPTFRSTRIYSPLTAKEVHFRLNSQFGYSIFNLPCIRTIRNKLNQLGYKPSKIKKCLPLKKVPETDAIFKTLHHINQEADNDKGTLRISLDTKATVKIGPFSRNGYNRQSQNACDHDFQPDSTLTPFGILLPQTGDNHLWFSETRVTADFIADRLEEMIPRWKQKFVIHTLVINADNGPESSGHRTQWLKRLVALSDKYQVSIQLAYYPPYHSKYNPVERLWGVLENHWRGEIIDSVGKALGLARSMTYRGIKPTVRKISKIYYKGITIEKKLMPKIEARLTRNSKLKSWFFTITPLKQMG